MKTKDFSYIVLLIVIIACMRGCDRTTIEEVVKYDTIKIDNPIHDTIIRENQRIVRIPVESFCDISEDDSVYIVEAETKHYRDSMYEAWVSGVDPSLDSIHVFNKTTIRTVTVEKPTYIRVSTPTNKPIQFGGFVSGQSSFDLNHINIQAGADLQLKNFDVKVGYNIGDYNYPFVGVEYKFR